MTVFFLLQPSSEQSRNSFVASASVHVVQIRYSSISGSFSEYPPRHLNRDNNYSTSTQIRQFRGGGDSLTVGYGTVHRIPGAASCRNLPLAILQYCTPKIRQFRGNMLLFLSMPHMSQMQSNFGEEALSRLEPFMLSITGDEGRIFAG